jgi:hypothetical protein
MNTTVSPAPRASAMLGCCSVTTVRTSPIAASSVAQRRLLVAIGPGDDEAVDAHRLLL